MKVSFTAGVLAISTSLLLAGFSRPVATGRDSAVKLKLNLRPGSKFAYTVQSAMNIDAQGTQMMQNLTAGNTFVVQSEAAGGKDLGVTYSRIAMNMEAGGQKMVYDSQDPSTKSSILGGIMGGMVGKSLSFTINSSGEVTAIRGTEELKKSVLAANTNPAFASQLEQSISESTLKGPLNQVFNIYPDHAVKSGESWIKNATLSMGPNNIKQANTYQLGSVQNGVAHLLVNGKLSTEGTVALAGTQTGTLDVDVATGLITSGKLKQTMAVPAGGAGSMSIDSDITITGQKL